MSTEVTGLQDNDRSVCVQFMLDHEMTPMEPRLLHGSFWKGDTLSGMIHSTQDGDWIAVIWKSPLEIEHIR